MHNSNFPLFRLAGLLARQVSAPIAARLKEHARGHPWFRRVVLAGVGRAYHVAQLRTRLWTLALRQPRTLPPISEEAALNYGADILGEAVIFGLGAAIIVFEVNRQANKQDDKELDVKSRWMAILMSLEELQKELELQQQELDRLESTLRKIAPTHYRDRPPAPLSEPPHRTPDNSGSEAKYPVDCIISINKTSMDRGQ